MQLTLPRQIHLSEHFYEELAQKCSDNEGPTVLVCCALPHPLVQYPHVLLLNRLFLHKNYHEKLPSQLSRYTVYRGITSNIDTYKL